MFSEYAPLLLVLVQDLVNLGEEGREKDHLVAQKKVFKSNQEGGLGLVDLVLMNFGFLNK